MVKIIINRGGIMQSGKREFNRPVMEVIKQRSSVRTYREEALKEEHQEVMKKYLEEVNGPFTERVRMRLIDSNAISRSADVKLGTYGIIRGTSTFIATTVEKGEKELEQVGYILEKVILYCTSLGLGTCWLGGTFKKGEFAKAMEVGAGETIPAVTPVGYPRERRGIVDLAMRFAAGSNKRKNWEELFFDSKFGSRLSREKAGKYEVPLEMVRIAPSASNKQPWRLVRNNEGFHFYLEHAKGYGSALGFDIQRIDIGIAMCHFEMTAQELGLSGLWKNIKPGTVNSPENTEYIVSWIFK